MSQDPVVRIRARAVRIIGFLRRPHCDRLLRHFSAERSVPVLTEFVYAFGRLGCTDSLKAVKKLQRHANGPLQIECIRTLSSFNAIPSNITLRLVDEDPLIRRDALLAMTPQMMKANQHRLSSLTQDPNPAVRCGLILALAPLRTHWAKAILSLMTNDQHPEVQYHLSRAIKSAALEEPFHLDKGTSKAPGE